MSAPTRPDRLVVVVGTATEIGKTWVTAHVAVELRARGRTVCARKPAQSFDAGDARTDAHVLAAATGEQAREVCPLHRWYEVPMAPPMAAAALGRVPITMDELVGELRWPDPAPVIGLVETAGGLRSPLADDGDARSLIERLEPDVVVVVADAGLGTINSLTLTLESLDHGSHMADEIVFLNRYDGTEDLHHRNRAWIAEHLGSTVCTGTAELVARLE